MEYLKIHNLYIFNFNTMKEHKLKFIKRGICFVILFLITVALLDTFYSNTIEKNKQLFRQDNEWELYKKIIPNNVLDYAIFGDSHARDGFNPDYVINSFNFATSGEDYVETYYKILKLLNKDNIKIKNIILEIDTHSFSNNIRTNKRLFQELDYYSKFISLKEISQLKEQNLLFTYIQNTFKIAGKGNEIMSYYFNPPTPTEINKGWTNNTHFLDINKSKISSNDFSAELTQINNRSLNYFKKILTLANEKNINIILIKYPMSIVYDLKLKEHNISRREYYKKLYKEIDKITTNYRILDYYNLYFNNINYFGDEDHLNYIGSTLLTKKIAEDVKTINQNNFLSSLKIVTNPIQKKEITLFEYIY